MGNIPKKGLGVQVYLLNKEIEIILRCMGKYDEASAIHQNIGLMLSKNILGGDNP